MKDLEYELSKLRIENGDVIVISGRNAHEVAMALAKMPVTNTELKDVPILVLNGNQTVETLDKNQMRDFGWVKPNGN